MPVIITTRTNKGSQLTHVELDTNLTDLRDAINVARLETIIITGATYTAASTQVILADATAQAIVITLPDSTTSLDTGYIVKKVDGSAFTVTLTTEGAQTLDGTSTKVLTTQWEYIRIISDGANWLLIS